MIIPYYSKAELNNNKPENSWERVIFQEFESTLLSKVRPFPCVFGVAGLKTDQLRFGFSEDMKASDIAEMLKYFVAHSRTYGKNTSLVVFSRPRPANNIETYEKRFWSLLSDLVDMDDSDWCSEIPTEMDSAHWEFCFAGEPIFVVCNTPSHVLRQSRRASTFMITFQPRWVFDNILADDEVTQKSLQTVRQRLVNYDLIEECPHLGAYGDPNNREYKQYFLNEDNGETKCPFHKLGKNLGKSEGEAA